MHALTQHKRRLVTLTEDNMELRSDLQKSSSRCRTVERQLNSAHDDHKATACWMLVSLFQEQAASSTLTLSMLSIVYVELVAWQNT